MYDFVLVNTHSKWIEVHIMQSITLAKTITKLQIIFLTHDLPHKVVMNNGSTFISQDFKEFIKANGTSVVYLFK